MNFPWKITNDEKSLSLMSIERENYNDGDPAPNRTHI
jgi:hypothetical protein